MNRRPKFNNKRKGNKASNQGPKGSLMKIERMDHPPQINGYEVTHKNRFRFTVTAATALSQISFQNLLDTFVIAATATAGFDFFDIVKIRAIEVWGQAALGTPSTITVAFVTGTGDRSIHTDTSLGVKPAYVKAVPSEKSLASFWQVSAAGAAFLITCPAGSVVDLSLSFKTAEELAPVATQNALAGATVGQNYFRGMDGLAFAATNFPPIGGVNVN
jgi:hypothetical protein